MASGIIKGNSNKKIRRMSVNYYKATSSSISANTTQSLTLTSGSSIKIPNGYKLCGIDRISTDVTQYNKSTATNKTNMNTSILPNLTSLSCSTTSTSLPSSFSVRVIQGNTSTSVMKYMEYRVEYVLVPEEVV